MKQQLKLVQEIHNEKSHSMTKILEMWFINKTNSFTSYKKCTDGLIKILNKSWETKKNIFQQTVQKIRSLGGKTLTKNRTSFTKLINAVTSKQKVTEGDQFLERMINSFTRQTSDFNKSAQKQLSTLINILKDLKEAGQKQNIHYRTIALQMIKKPCSVKQIFVLSNLVLRQIQKLMKFLRLYKQTTITLAQKQQQIISSLIDNLKNYANEFPEQSIQIGDLTKDLYSLTVEKQIPLVDIIVTDPSDKQQIQIKAEELLSFTSTEEQEFIWTSNVEGLQASFLNQMSMRTWNNIDMIKQNKNNMIKVIITTDGYLLLIDKYRIVEYQLNLAKIVIKNNDSNTVQIMKSKNALLKLIGLEYICSLKFSSSEQCEEFILHTQKFS